MGGVFYPELATRCGKGSGRLSGARAARSRLSRLRAQQPGRGGGARPRLPAHQGAAARRVRVPPLEGVRPTDPAHAAAPGLGVGAGAGARRQPRAGARARTGAREGARAAPDRALHSGCGDVQRPRGMPRAEES